MSELLVNQTAVQKIAEAIASVLDVEVTIVDDQLRRIAGTGRYAMAVGEQLAVASPEFMTDLHRFSATRELYELNTAAAARRVGELIDEGVQSGEFRSVNAAFAGDLTATMMSRIQRREVSAATGLDDADAYRQLASILTAGIRTD